MSIITRQETIDIYRNSGHPVLVPPNGTWSPPGTAASASYTPLYWNQIDGEKIIHATWQVQWIPGAPSAVANVIALCGIINGQNHIGIGGAAIWMRTAGGSMQWCKDSVSWAAVPNIATADQPINWGIDVTDAIETMRVQKLDWSVGHQLAACNGISPRLYGSSLTLIWQPI